MERSISDLNLLERFATEFCNILEKHVEYIIVSGFVAIASGRVRGTEDIDIIIKKLDFNKFKKLHEELVKHDFVCMQSDEPESIYEYLTDKASVRYTWKDKPIPEMELKFVKDIIDDEQFRTRKKLKLTGMSLWFSSVEINIAFKEEYLKSDKDIEDANHLRIVYKDEINESEIQRFKKLIKKIRL
ncbi:hypothetical protein HYU06_03590 [Candidatus Woesearchaeota archaeon]|nr:hypothetical protein [Candidatus Woesearchaeota archaeon]